MENIDKSPIQLLSPAEHNFEGNNVSAPLENSSQNAPRLQTLTADELLHLKLPPREYALAPILPFPGLAMIYAPRGLGKTYLALSISHAIASGSRALRWDSPRPLRVLHIDGEMPAPALQERLAQIIAGSGVALPDANRLRFMIGDLVPNGLPNIAGPGGMRAIEQAAADADVILLDNLSTLAAGMRENEADDWGAFQAWLMRMRRAKKLVILIHHAGKGGNQRGTSRREDALDTVIALRRPQDYTPEEGARFEVHVEKARGAMGPDVAPFEARLVEASKGGLAWVEGPIIDRDLDKALALIADGKSLREAARETGISKSALSRKSRVH
ncbi:MAG: AAA family ATPase [Acetobacteraceae bacterium]|jgi:putative DNA primase/helicase